jgi:prolipoprotein diacylglyceryl transferase
MLLFINWNVDPEIFSIGSLSIRYYGLLWALSFVFSYLIMKKIFLKEGLTVEILDKFSTYIFIGTILGARFGHVIFYQLGYYLENPAEILMIWKGGLASHGAAVGILLAVWYFTRKYKKSYLWVADRLAIVVALAGFLIRMGNLVNSEIYGIATTLPWGFIFERNGEIIAKHPTQIYEGAILLIVFAVLIYMYFKTKLFDKKGLAFGIFSFSIFCDRFFIEFIKEKQVDFESSMILDMGQILSIPLILLGIYLIYQALFKKA